MKGALWQRKALHWCCIYTLEQRGGQESRYTGLQAKQRVFPPQAAPPHAAHLVMFLKQPLQELVTQVVEFCGAAGGQAEPVGRDSSEQAPTPPQALDEEQRVSQARAHPEHTAPLPHPRSRSAVFSRPGYALTQPLTLGRRTRGCTVTSPWHICAAQTAGEMMQPSLCLMPWASEGYSYPRSAFHQHSPVASLRSLLSVESMRQLTCQPLSLLPDHHLRGGREQRRDSSCGISQEGYADSSLLPTESFCLSSGRDRTAFKNPSLMSREVRDKPSFPTSFLAYIRASSTGSISEASCICHQPSISAPAPRAQ